MLQGSKCLILYTIGLVFLSLLNRFYTVQCELESRLMVNIIIHKRGSFNKSNKS